MRRAHSPVEVTKQTNNLQKITQFARGKFNYEKICFHCLMQKLVRYSDPLLQYCPEKKEK